MYNFFYYLCNLLNNLAFSREQTNYKLNSNAMKIKKVYLTEDDTILIVKASTDGTKDNKYVSVTADEIEPLSYSDAEERTRESLEDGELWRMAVEAERTELGLQDWIEMVINVDGSTCQVDNSLYPNEIEIDGEDYIFDSVSCGCRHDLILSLTEDFNALIDLHLNNNKKAIEKAEKLMSNLVADDIDKKVEEFAKQIVSIEV